MNFDFEKFFKFSIIGLKINRSYPNISRDKKWCCQFVTMHGLYLGSLLIPIYCAIFQDLKHKDFSEASYKGIPLIAAIIINLKYATLLKNQKLIFYLIETIKKDYKLAEGLPEEEQMILMNYANKGQWFSKLWFVLYAAGCAILLLKSVALTTYYIIIYEFRFVPLLSYISYPCAITTDNMKNEWKLSIVSYFAGLWFIFYSFCMYVGFIPLGPIFMTHACGQLEVVKKRVQELFPEHVYDPEATQEKMKYIIQQLQQTYKFVDCIEKSFQMIYEMTLKTTSIILPITLYQVKENYNSGFLNVEFICIIIVCTALPGCLCYYGDSLIQMGESVKQAIYMSGWEKHWDRSTRATILILLTRSMRPVAIRTMFRIVCFDALTDVFRQAYAIFNLMNAVM